MQKDDISLAAWALVDEFREGKWKALDLPKITREDFGINGIEFVNTLFEVPTNTYLNALKQNAEDYGTELVLIMVDEEGDGCAPTKEERKQFVINQRKWIDIAHYLGCHAIRTNCRGLEISSAEEALKLSAETYHHLLDYAKDSGVEVLIENHGGYSNDPDWMVALMKEVNNPLFGTYPDWREPSPQFDNYTYLEKTISFAKGMSYRNQPTEGETAKLIGLCQREGYHGWYGIESKGRDAVRLGKSLLNKYLLNK
ncbi:MAG TPA: TIM barrel protein [Hanamia sp.]|nr:TIM barrel protein [Hanamia sp.]